MWFYWRKGPTRWYAVRDSENPKDMGVEVRGVPFVRLTKLDELEEYYVDLSQLAAKYPLPANADAIAESWSTSRGH